METLMQWQSLPKQTQLVDTSCALHWHLTPSYLIKGSQKHDLVVVILRVYILLRDYIPCAPSTLLLGLWALPHRSQETMVVNA